VGANVGQTIAFLRATLDNPVIHSFEPGHRAFAELARRCSGIPDLYLNNFALGSRSTLLELQENIHHELSSFLDLGVAGGGEVSRRLAVDVTTIDNYCDQCKIDKIDILKSDTQGFELEVLKGAETLFESHRVHFVLLEITFAELYKSLPRMDTLYAFLANRGFCLVSFYKFYYQNDRAGWTDAMFVDPQYSTI
jgi:FkbM family methyltransferase